MHTCIFMCTLYICTFRHVLMYRHAFSKRVFRFRFGCNSLEICQLQYFWFTFRTNPFNYSIQFILIALFKKNHEKCRLFFKIQLVKIHEPQDVFASPTQVGEIGIPCQTRIFNPIKICFKVDLDKFTLNLIGFEI